MRTKAPQQPAIRAKRSAKSVRDRSRAELKDAEQRAFTESLVRVLHQCADAAEYEDQAEERSATADDDRQQDRHYCAAGVDSVTATNSNAITNQSPNQSDEPATAGHDYEKIGRPIRIT